MGAVLDPRQGFENNVLIHVNDVGCRHVGEAVDQVDERRELCVGCQQGKNVAIAEMLPQCLQEVEVTGPCLKHKKIIIKSKRNKGTEEPMEDVADP